MRYGWIALGCALLVGCDNATDPRPQSITLRLSGPSEVRGIWVDRSEGRFLQCSAGLTIQVSGEGTGVWLFGRKDYRDARRPLTFVLTAGELELIFGTDVIEPGNEYFGQIDAEGTGTFNVDLTLAYEVFLDESTSLTREVDYSYTCLVP